MAFSMTREDFDKLKRFIENNPYSEDYLRDKRLYSAIGRISWSWEFRKLLNTDSSGFHVQLYLHELDGERIIRLIPLHEKDRGRTLVIPESRIGGGLMYTLMVDLITYNDTAFECKNLRGEEEVDKRKRKEEENV